MRHEEINAMFNRDLKSDGYKYDHFFPKVNCKVYKRGYGDAIYILDFMKSVVDKHSKQVSKLAQELSTGDLNTTIDNFWSFQRNYIQYDKDLRLQTVKSPACIWSSRFSGTDCKSFAVMGSSLCKQAGIISYLRQIKQFEGDRISHVYVVIPIDQKTGSLKKGHYVLDGSNKYNIEQNFTWKRDLKMEKLPVVGMNSASPYSPVTCGCENHVGMNFGGFEGNPFDTGSLPAPSTGGGSTGGGFDFSSLFGGISGGGGGFDAASLLGGGGETSGIGATAGAATGAAFGLPPQAGAAIGDSLEGIIATFSGGTGACGIRFENERKKGIPFFHNKEIRLKWRDAEYFCQFFNKSLLDFGWRTNSCPSSPAQGKFKRAEDFFFENLHTFLDAVVLGQTQIPESLLNDDDIPVLEYLQAFASELSNSSSLPSVSNSGLIPAQNFTNSTGDNDTNQPSQKLLGSNSLVMVIILILIGAGTLVYKNKPVTKAIQKKSKVNSKKVSNV